MKTTNAFLFLSKTLIVCTFFCISTFSYSQSDTSGDNQYGLVGFFGCGRDSLFWNDIAFGCHRTPISQFVGYDTIYPNVVEMFSFYDFYYDKGYTINWAIIDSSLYLIDIPLISYNINDNEGNDRSIMIRALTIKNKTRHQAIENLTNSQFVHPTFKVPENLKSKINPNGVLPAKWFTGKLYIKPIEYLMMSYNQLKTSDDVELSFYILTFEKGKITNIDKRIIVDGTLEKTPRGFN